MSLRAFHIFFIFCSMILVGALGLWQLNHYGASRDLVALLLSLFFFTGAAGLAVYLYWFIQKTKKAGE